MPAHRMVTIDGVRYRPEHVPAGAARHKAVHKAVQSPEAPASAAEKSSAPAGRGKSAGRKTSGRGKAGPGGGDG